MSEHHAKVNNNTKYKKRYPDVKQGDTVTATPKQGPLQTAIRMTAPSNFQRNTGTGRKAKVVNNSEPVSVGVPALGREDESALSNAQARDRAGIKSKTKRETRMRENAEWYFERKK